MPKLKKGIVWEYNPNPTWEEVSRRMVEMDKARGKRRREEELKINNNLKALNKRAKELGKGIPMEVLGVVLLNRPVGTRFLEQYKEWM